MAGLTPLGERLANELYDPKDPQLRHEMYSFMYSAIATGYFGLLYADGDHPDFMPLYNQAFNHGFPNPDDVYYVAPLDDKGEYRISGFRGTVRIVDFQIGSGMLVPRSVGSVG